MKNGDHGFMLVWQIVGAVAFSGLVSALLRRVVEQYISAPRALILFVCLVVIISTILVARSNWNRWEPAAVADAETIPATHNPPMPDNNINISSTNQSGGITAQNVHVSELPPGRSIPQAQLDHIKNNLPHSTKGSVTITFLESDLEAVSFANEIESVLKSCGFSVVMGPMMMMSGPKGYPVGLFFEIADPNSVPPHAQSIGDAFASAGFTAITSVRSDMDRDKLSIIVGGLPK